MTRKVKAVILIPIIVAGVTISSFTFVIKPYIDYQTAIAYLKSKKYASAEQSFENLGNYKDSISMVKETQYQNGVELLKRKRYTDAIDIFEKSVNYKDSKAKITEAKYEYAENELSNSTENINDIIYLYSQCKDYKDSKDKLNLCNEILNMQGNWAHGCTQKNFALTNYTNPFDSVLTISNINIQNQTNSNKTNMQLIVRNANIIDGNHTIYTLSNGNSQLKATDINGNSIIYDKLGPNYQAPKSPYVGMSESELQNSTWGTPSHINKTTTVNDVNEQWVYPNNKYVYLDNGIVTAIQQ